MSRRMGVTSADFPPARDRNVTVLAASIFVLALGEELWQAYLPRLPLGARRRRGGRRPLRLVQGSARQRLPVPRRKTRGSPGKAARPAVVHGDRDRGLHRLRGRAELAVRVSRPAWGDGVEGWRLPDDLCGHRRFAPAGPPGDGLCGSVHAHPRAAGHRRAARRARHRHAWYGSRNPGDALPHASCSRSL